MHPLSGEDLAALLPWYRPTRELARETNGDFRLFLDRSRRSADAGCGRPQLCRRVGRKTARTGFTLVMPRWNGWTSDLDVSAGVFGRYYPERAGQMRQAVTLARLSARAPGSGAAAYRDDLRLLLDDLGPWLAAEYEREIGAKTPRSA